MQLRTQLHPAIPTRDERNQINGFVVPLYNIHEESLQTGQLLEQVYLTAVAPHTSKGPHLHHIRTGYFTCIAGNLRVVCRVHGRYEVHYTGERHGYATIEIPPGVAARLDNLDDTTALALNMPRPAWRPDMNDEHGADFTDFVEIERHDADAHQGTRGS